MLKSTLILLICFLIAANPAVYRATRSVLGGWIATPEGTAKLGGLVLHAVVFMVLVKVLKRTTTSGYAHAGAMDTHGADEIGGLSTKAQEVPHTLQPAAYA